MRKINRVNKQSVNDVIEMIKDASVLKEEREQLMNSINNSKGELSILTEKLGNKQSQISEKDKELVKLSKEIEGKQKELDAVLNKIKGVEADIVEISAVLSVKKESLNKEVLETQTMLDELETKVSELTQSATSKSVEIERLGKKYISDKEKADNDISGLKEELSRISGQVTDKMGNLKDIEDGIEKNRVLCDESEQKIKDFQDKKQAYQEVKDMIDEKNTELQKIEIDIKNGTKEIENIGKTKGIAMEKVEEEKFKLAAMAEQLDQKGKNLIERENRVNTLSNTLKKHLKKFDIPITI